MAHFARFGATVDAGRFVEVEGQRGPCRRLWTGWGRSLWIRRDRARGGWESPSTSLKETASSMSSSRAGSRFGAVRRRARGRHGFANRDRDGQADGVVVVVVRARARARGRCVNDGRPRPSSWSGRGRGPRTAGGVQPWAESIVDGRRRRPRSTTTRPRGGWRRPAKCQSYRGTMVPVARYRALWSGVASAHVR
jgi:hypothetical protein